jgi:hypothetical protein
MPELTFHGCFGRFAGDASEPIDFLSNEWTQVRNKQRKGDKKKNISKSSCNWKFAKRNATLEVAPKEQVAYLTENNQKIKKNTKNLSKMPVQSTSRKLEQKKFENYISNLTEQDIDIKLKELLKNEIELQQEQDNMNSSLKSAKTSLERSVEMIQIQQKLYQILLEFEMNRSSTYWNFVMGNRSFRDFEHDPLHEEMNKKISKLNKAKSQLNKLDDSIKNTLYALQKTYGNRFTLAHDQQNYSCLNNGYIDCYGNIHDEYQPYPNEDSRCYHNMRPRRKIPKYDKVKASFLRRKLRYQKAKLSLDTERELKKMRYPAANSSMDSNTYMFKTYHRTIIRGCNASSIPWNLNLRTNISSTFKPKRSVKASPENYNY